MLIHVSMEVRPLTVLERMSARLDGMAVVLAVGPQQAGCSLSPLESQMR